MRDTTIPWTELLFDAQGHFVAFKTHQPEPATPKEETPHDNT
jgi:hypothetical protein